MSPPLAITGADLETTRVWNDVSTQQRMSLMISSIFIKYEKLPGHYHNTIGFLENIVNYH